MKKMIFTLVLAIAGSVWMMSKAQCLVPSTEQEGPYVEELTGLLCLDAYPCPYNEICPSCLTVVLRSKEKKYYLTGPVAESIDVPTDWQYVKVVVSGITGYTELGNNEYYNWLTVEKWSYSEEPVTTNIQTYGYVEDESGTRLEGIGVIVHTTDWTVSDTVYSQAQGMFISSIKGIAYPVNSMEVTVSDITGKFKEQTKSTTYTYECGVDFNPETNTASNSEELLFVLQENKIRTTLPSLCDEWHVLHEPFECMGPYCYLETDIYRLTRDTGISIFIDMPVKYFKLEKNGQYIGALHEGNNRDIYYVPANSQNAYLLYAFNAQVGDELENVWLGGETEKEDCTNAHNATVIAISDSNPRIFTLEIIPFTSYEGMEVYPYWMEWIEGVGMSDGPVGAYDSNKLCPSAADLGVFTLLCAYKVGEQVYSSPKAQKYGCEFNGYYVEEHPTDTIPLYARDDPGSSTVDPVDPNQIYATLTGNVLTVHNNTGAQVTFTMNNTSVNNVAARVRTNVEPVSFTDSVSVELSEDGIYEILLASEEWNYTIFGSVNYIRSATEITKEETHTTKKVLRGTQILIEREGKTYTLTGQEVK